MNYKEKLKDRIKPEKNDKPECDPTSTMFLNKEQCWQLEQSVRNQIKEICKNALEKAQETQ